MLLIEYSQNSGPIGTYQRVHFLELLQMVICQQLIILWILSLTISSVSLSLFLILALTPTFAFC
jgi:hypothetical protein